MAVAQHELAGMRVLVVEDNLLLAEATAVTLEMHGCTVVGPAPTLAAGLDLARKSDLDGALLDVNLRGEYCFPIAEQLRTQGVPFLFVTGYDNRGIIPADFQRTRRLDKPVDPAELVEAMAHCFGGASGN